MKSEPDGGIDLYRGVSDAELLRAHGLFVAEGRLVVRRVLENPRYRVRSVMVSPAARCALADRLERVPPAAVFERPLVEFREMTGYDVHRGCLALVERPAPQPVDRLLESAGPEAPIVVLDRVANADNVGGVFRNIAAFGASAVVLGPGCCDPLYRKAVRTSMGAVLTTPFAHVADWPRAIEAIGRAGFATVALTPHPPSVALHDLLPQLAGRRIALIVGSEGAGLSPEVNAMARWRATIPTTPAVDSLNLSVATAIALYELRGRRAGV